MAVAAYAAWALERTKQTLREAGASSEETAKRPTELNLDERWLKMSANTRARNWRGSFQGWLETIEMYARALSMHMSKTLPSFINF